jgi:hypothetical protein
VINFDMPNTVDANPPHGRTGRAARPARPSVCGQADETTVREIEHGWRSIERRKLPDFDYSSLGPKIRGWAARVDQGNCSRPAHTEDR